MPDVSSLYPQAPQQQQGLLSGDPTKVIGLVNALNQNRLFQEQFPALAQQPAAALRGQEISNQTGLQDQQNQARRAVSGFISGSLAGNPNPSRDDVHNAKALAARTFPDVALKYPDMIPAVGDVVLKHPKGIRAGVGVLTNSQLTPEGQSLDVTAPPGPGGAPRVMKLPATNVGDGTRETGLAPGEEALISSPAARAERLQGTSSTSPQYHADLENLKQDSKVLDNLGGPTFEVEKKLNQLTSRLGGFGVTMTPEQLKAGESFDKIANQISTSQAGNLGAATDAGRHMVVGANPSTSMSSYGREGVIDMLHGNQDAIDRSRKNWLKARANGAKVGSFDQFMDIAGEQIDPRVFQYNRMSGPNQHKFLDNMGDADYKEFQTRYKDALDKNWVKEPKKVENAK